MILCFFSSSRFFLWAFFFITTISFIFINGTKNFCFQYFSPPPPLFIYFSFLFSPLYLFHDFFPYLIIHSFFIYLSLSPFFFLSTLFFFSLINSIISFLIPYLNSFYFYSWKKLFSFSILNIFTPYLFLFSYFFPLFCSFLQYLIIQW